MYAISFDLDTKKLETSYQTSYTNAYSDIKKFFSSHNFTSPQGSLYLSLEDASMDNAMDTIVDLVQEFTWFAECVKDIQVFRVEENSNFTSIVKKLAMAMGKSRE